MAWLLLGLALFLGAHSVRIFAAGWRDALVQRLGAGRWKGLYSLISGAGLGLIIFGYGQARGAAPLYALPPALTHLTFALVWLGFICVVAAYGPANHIKRWLGDPMVFGVGLWALGHLLVRATPAALVLFGGFLLWAAADFVSLRSRAGGAAAGAAAKASNTALVILAGSILAGVFAQWLHLWLIGVSPLAFLG
jgi:uncharacterized membrane protein